MLQATERGVGKWEINLEPRFWSGALRGVSVKFKSLIRGLILDRLCNVPIPVEWVSPG